MTQGQRETKYTRTVMECLRRRGHATNAELAAQVRRELPSVSDTTIHRVTQRFYERSQVGVAPAAPDGAMRYDSNRLPHDHFMCQECNTLRDVMIPPVIRKQLEALVEGCCLNGSLLIVGDCKKCEEN